MTLQELYKLLLKSGYPVAYRDYTGELKKALPKPPFVVYSVLDEDFDGGDLRKFIRERSMNVELYTNGKDLTAEDVMDRLLIDFPDTEKNEALIDDGFMLVRYTFTIRDTFPVTEKEG